MMISAESFVAQWTTPVSKDENKDWFARWGSYELGKYDPDVVSALNISDASKTFLTQAGLPRKAYHGVCQFGGIFAHLPRLENVWPHVGGRHLHEQYRVLGGNAFLYNNQTMYDGYICLRNKMEEQVYFVERAEDYSARLVNSSVSQLAEFLLIFRSYVDDALQHKWDEKTLRLERAKETLGKLRDVDAAATEDGGLWEEALLEIEFGM